MISTPIPTQTPTPTAVQTQLGLLRTNPAGFVQDIYTIGLGLIGGVALLFIIYGGYLILTSQGDPTQLRNGKTTIFYAIVGLLLAIFGFVFYEIVAGDVLKVPGIG